MTKKTLPTETIIDDLADSPFFKKRPASDGQNINAISPTQKPQSGHSHNDRKPKNKPLTKRPYTRRTFDFYEDQIAYLTKLSLEERLAGRNTSMNGLIREAIDGWIKERTTGK